MVQDKEQLNEALSWERKILNGFWIVVLVSLLAELVAYIIKLNTGANDIQDFLIHTVAIPSGGQALLILINEFLYRKRPKSRPYFIIVTAVFIGAVLIYGNQSVKGIQYVMMLPMLVSVFQFSKKYLTFAYITVVLSLTIIYLTFPFSWVNMTIYEKFAMFYILTGGYFIAVQLLNRANNLLEQLVKSKQSERDLLVKNTVMETLTKTDALTGLYNHKTFQEYFEHMVEHSERNQMQLHLAVIDIDNFKSINDTYGHVIGDLILKRVAEVLKTTFTENDIISRYGGEEFAILFPSKEFEQAKQLCENARQAIWQLQHDELDGRRVSISIGLGTYSNGLGRSNFFIEVDELMYEAKKTGKNKTVYKDCISETIYSQPFT